MPAFSDYELEHYQTVADIHNAKNPAGYALVEEGKKKSSFFTNISMIESNEQKTHIVRREDEMVGVAHFANEDEGFYYDENTVSGGEVEFKFARVTASTKWRADTEDLDAPARAGLEEKKIKAAMDAIVTKRTRAYIYGKQTDEDGKGIDGLMSHLVRPYAYADLMDMDEKLQNWSFPVNPFDNRRTGSLLMPEDCLCISNQENVYGKTISGGVIDTIGGVEIKQNTTGHRFSSIIACAFGADGVTAAYPKSKGDGGLRVMYKQDIPASYRDPRDGRMKDFYENRFHAESFFGIGVVNRFCLAGIRNIDIYHDNREERKAEIERLEKNLLTIKNLYAKSGVTKNLMFFCSADVIRAVEEYQKELFPVAFYANQNSRNYDGSSKLSIYPQSVTVADGITLIAEPVMMSTESYIA